MRGQKTGVADLPLHWGEVPRWLFQRMALLAREITTIIVMEFGTAELLRRLSDPFWFQAFGCVLGFDWHSSGLTTTTCGALKEGLKDLGDELGIFVAGGKGGTSRRAPEEILARGELISVDPTGLVYASRMAAKVDNTALQDGFQIYHHTFVFDREGNWCVIQQGMNPVNRYARRYHWLGETVKSFVCEPHSAICCDLVTEPLNLVAAESEEARRVSTLLACEKPDKLVRELKRLKTMQLPPRHHVLLEDIAPDRLYSVFLRTYERQPEDFVSLLEMEGVGPKTVRALSLIAELLYGAPVSYRDPVRFSFAHGGKDGHPYRVDRHTYDRSIEILGDAVRKAKLGQREKLEALKRLSRYALRGN